MTTAQRVWCRVPAWWIPVWVSLLGDTHVTDPLEDAVFRLIELGRGQSRDIALTLQVDVSLVHSALDSLEETGRIQQQGEQWVVRQEPTRDETPREREGWAVWDSQARRPLLQVVLGARPHVEPNAPEGWELLSCDADPAQSKRPKDGDVDRALSYLPELPELRGLEPLGSGLRTFDPGLIRRIRRNSRERLVSGSAYVPVEFRPVTGSVVWRPCVFPFARAPSELDPAAWGGLLGRVDAASRQRLEARQEDAAGTIARFALQEAGYSSMSELREAASRKARYELAGVWDNPGWDKLQQMIVTAEIFATIAHAVKHASRRQALHCWADVLEFLMGLLHQRFAEAFSKDRFREVRNLPVSLRKERVLAQRSVLRGSVDHLLGVVADDNKLGSLRDALERSASIGPRILGLAFARVFVPDVGKLLEPALADCPAFFDELSEANVMRTRVVHLDVGETDSAEDLDLEDFRHRVLRLAQVSMQISMQ
jgi:DnaJ-domain-containing protein 1